MGAYNVTATVSGLSLHEGTPCVFFLLLPNPHMAKGDTHVSIGRMTRIYTNEDGAEHFFVPFALLIFGKYNDNGYLDDIQMDENIRCIERVLQCSIDEFMIHHDAVVTNRSPISRLSGMFEHREVYNALVEEGRHNIAEPERGYPSLYDDFAEEVAQYVAKGRPLDIESCPYRSCQSHGLQRYVKHWEYFPELYEESLCKKSDAIRNGVINLLRFRNAMFSCNRFFFPAMNGEQHGNPRASRTLLEASLRIIHDEIRENEDNF